MAFPCSGSGSDLVAEMAGCAQSLSAPRTHPPRPPAPSPTSTLSLLSHNMSQAQGLQSRPPRPPPCLLHRCSSCSPAKPCPGRLRALAFPTALALTTIHSSSAWCRAQDPFYLPCLPFKGQPKTELRSNQGCWEVQPFKNRAKELATVSPGHGCLRPRTPALRGYGQKGVRSFLDLSFLRNWFSCFHPSKSPPAPRGSRTFPKSRW